MSISIGPNTNFAFSSQAFLSQLIRIFPAALFMTSQGDRRVKVAPYRLVPRLTVLKLHTGLGFTQLIDITAVDSPEKRERFEVVCSLLSPTTAQRLRVSVSTSEGQPLPSVTSVFSSAG
jgi:NADH:ubiquinone oxidoreductase subunit C